MNVVQSTPTTAEVRIFDSIQTSIIFRREKRNGRFVVIHVSTLNPVEGWNVKSKLEEAARVARTEMIKKTIETGPYDHDTLHQRMSSVRTQAKARERVAGVPIEWSEAAREVIIDLDKHPDDLEERVTQVMTIIGWEGGRIANWMPRPFLPNPHPSFEQNLVIMATADPRPKDRFLLPKKRARKRARKGQGDLFGKRP